MCRRDIFVAIEFKVIFVVVVVVIVVVVVVIIVIVVVVVIFVVVDALVIIVLAYFLLSSLGEFSNGSNEGKIHEFELDTAGCRRAAGVLPVGCRRAVGRQGSGSQAGRRALRS